MILTIRKQSGFSLIEVLVALVVVSVGILGLAGLQHTGVRNNHNALLHSQASFLAYEIADYMRSNQAGVRTKKYSPAFPPTIDKNYCKDNNCNSTQMADYHLVNWHLDLATSLPDGRGQVTCIDNDTTDTDPCTPGSRIVITIQWSEAGINGEEALRFDTEIQL